MGRQQRIPTADNARARLSRRSTRRRPPMLADFYIQLTGWQTAAIAAVPLVAAGLGYVAGRLVGAARAPEWMRRARDEAQARAAAENAMRLAAERDLDRVRERVARLSALAVHFTETASEDIPREVTR
jgi:hypothetical protein